MNLPMEFRYAVAGVAATLIVQAAHARGIRLPIIEAVLDWIGRAQRPAPTSKQNGIELSPSGARLRPEVTQTPDGKWVLEWRE